jgi:hypothetical protein
MEQVVGSFSALVVLQLTSSTVKNSNFEGNPKLKT